MPPMLNNEIDRANYCIHLLLIYYPTYFKLFYEKEHSPQNLKWPVKR